MFELRYLSVNNLNAMSEIVMNRDDVVFTPVGPLVRQTQKTWTLIPWSRVTGLSGLKGELLEITGAE